MNPGDVFGALKRENVIPSGRKAVKKSINQSL